VTLSAVCYADHLVFGRVEGTQFHVDNVIDVEPSGLNG
jgi:hypothetical protein